MSKIFFIDDEHAVNYNIMIEMFPESLRNPEYQAACYISSLPWIFDKFKKQLSSISIPVEWIINWEDKYLPKQNETDQEYRNRSNIEIDYDLTHSMQQMGKLALNLWNGYDYFNLMDCLSVVDDRNFQAIKQAIDIRMKKID